MTEALPDYTGSFTVPQAERAVESVLSAGVGRMTAPYAVVAALTLPASDPMRLRYVNRLGTLQTELEEQASRISRTLASLTE